MKYILLAVILCWNISVNLVAQEIKVKSFKQLKKDRTALEQPRKDLNDNLCSIVKIVTQESNLQFEGNVIGEPIYQDGGVWVYMTSRSARLLIRHEKYGMVRYSFPQSVKKDAVYELTLEFVEAQRDKIRTLVMPTVGFCSKFPSYGIMFGVVKKTGFYFKFMNDFGGLSISGDVDCSKLDDYWLTGRSKQKRLAATAGLIQRLWKPFYIYAGAGYGYRKLLWEVYQESRDYNTPSRKVWSRASIGSSEGAEVEIGGIYRINNFAVSLGVQTNSFSVYQTNCSIGIMF